MKSKTAIIIAIFSGILGVFLVLGQLAKEREKDALGKNLKNVVVAKKNIAQYSLLSPDMVQIMQIPSKYIQPGSIQYVKDLIDEDNNPRFVTLVPVMEDEAILVTKLSLPGGAGLSAVIPKGKRAITIPVSSGISSSGLIKPGNIIDLIATFEDKSIFFLQNLKVLSVGSKIIGEAEVSKKSKKSSLLSGFTEGVSSGGEITIAVTPQEALKISYARGKCEFNVVLKNTIDESVVTIKSVNKYNLLDGSYSSKKKTGIKIYRGVEMFNQ